MLHNILINAGLYTEIAQQGRFINIVLAAGEITARIRKSSGEVQQTNLVSGMAFEVPTGYESIAFTADDTQQTKVWLSNMPLNYTPLESKVVGSSSLSSTTASAFFGEAAELLPSKSGRGKITLYADKEFFIGGVGLTPESAIRIPPQTIFEMATQGAIFAYTQNPQDYRSARTIFTPNSAVYDGLFSGIIGNTKGVKFSEDQQKGYRISGSKIGVIDALGLKDGLGFSDLTHTASIISNESVKSANDFCALGYASNKIYLYRVDFDTSVITESIYNVAGVTTGIRTWDFDGENIVFADWSGKVYIGALADSDLIESVTPITNLQQVMLLVTGEVYAQQYGSQGVVSNDLGATWLALGGLGFNQTTGDLIYKGTDGKLYAQSNLNLKLYRSIDNARTWQEIYSVGDALNSFLAVGDAVYICAGQKVHYWNGNGEKSVYDLGSLFSGSGFAVGGSDGFLYLFKSSGVHVFSGGNVEFGGGLPVAIMAEVN